MNRTLLVARSCHPFFCLQAIIVSSLLCVSLTLAGEAVPLGHPDFHPSPDRPIGWRGDRHGAFPGATPVSEWDGNTGKNIAWKCKLSTPSFSQPIVVGEKVFTCADPNSLICVNVHDGKILWQKEVDHTTLMPPDKAKTAKEELAYFNNKLFPIYRDSWDALRKLQDTAKGKGLPAGFWDALVKLGDPESTRPEVKAYKNADLDKALTDPALKTIFDALLKVRREYGFPFVNEMGRIDKYDSASARALYERAWRCAAEYNISLWPMRGWYGYTTMTFAMPCSDGRYV